MEATAFTDQCNQKEKACKNGESIYKSKGRAVRQTITKPTNPNKLLTFKSACVRRAPLTAMLGNYRANS
jgi:hypothetical protein